MTLQTVSVDFMLEKADTYADREAKYNKAVHELSSLIADMGVFKVTKGTAFSGRSFVEKIVISIEVDLDDAYSIEAIYDGITNGNEPLDKGCTSCSN